MIISFALTAYALSAGLKDVTRRWWKPTHALRMHAGLTVKAYNKDPRAHGHHIADIRILDVRAEPPDRLQADDHYAQREFVREGGFTVFPYGIDQFREFAVQTLNSERTLCRVEFELLRLVSPVETTWTGPTFFGTFGQGQHDGLLKDHWVEIPAPCYDEARAIMSALFGQKWSMLDTAAEFDPSFYPKGKIGLMRAFRIARKPDHA